MLRAIAARHGTRERASVAAFDRLRRRRQTAGCKGEEGEALHAATLAYCEQFSVGVVQPAGHTFLLQAQWPIQCPRILRSLLARCKLHRRRPMALLCGHCAAGCALPQAARLPAGRSRPRHRQAPSAVLPICGGASRRKRDATRAGAPGRSVRLYDQIRSDRMRKSHAHDEPPLARTRAALRATPRAKHRSGRRTSRPTRFTAALRRFGSRRRCSRAPRSTGTSCSRTRLPVSSRAPTCAPAQTSHSVGPQREAAQRVRDGWMDCADRSIGCGSSAVCRRSGWLHR